MTQKILISAGIIVFIIVVLMLALSESTFLTINPGERGVMFRPYGGGLDKERVYSQGSYYIAPWNSMYIYNVREFQLEDRMEVLSGDSRPIEMDIAVRIRPEHSMIGYLHEEFGVNYRYSLVIPEVRSSVRRVMGRLTLEELQILDKEKLEALIQKDLEAVLINDYIVLSATFIRSINLPGIEEPAIEERANPDRGRP